MKFKVVMEVELEGVDNMFEVDEEVGKALGTIVREELELNTELIVTILESKKVG